MANPFDTTPAPAPMDLRFRALLNSMHSGILEINANGALIHANRAANMMMPDLPPTPAPPGWDVEFGEGVTFHDVHGAPMSAEEGPLFEALRTEEPQRDWQFSIEMRDGQIIHLMGTAEPLFNAEGFLTGVICSYQDITELISLQRALEQQLTETKSANQELRLTHGELSRAHNLQAGFIANFSHDLRTPLSGVLGFADLLAISPNIIDEEEEFLQEIIDAGDSLRMMIDSVITYSNILSGNVRIVADWHDMDALVEKSSEAARRLCIRRGLDFQMEILRAPEKMCVDEMRLQEVLEQLLDNAVKFTERGQVCLKVSTNEDNVVFEISDTGPGISAEAEMRLYEPYSKTLVKDGQLRRGVGLGLTLVKALCDLMNGKVDYVTSTGYGTTFRVELPLIFTLAL
jgi:PAS domain S-box-containing protein